MCFNILSSGPCVPSHRFGTQQLQYKVPGKAWSSAIICKPSSWLFPELSVEPNTRLPQKRTSLGLAMDLAGSYSDGRERLTFLLSQQWMRAETLVRTYYPGEIPVLSATRGLPWGEEMTGKWLCDVSALRGDAWPGVEEVTFVAQTLIIFNNSIESVAFGTDALMPIQRRSWWEEAWSTQ